MRLCSREERAAPAAPTWLVLQSKRLFRNHPRRMTAAHGCLPDGVHPTFRRARGLTRKAPGSGLRESKGAKRPRTHANAQGAGEQARGTSRPRVQVLLDGRRRHSWASSSPWRWCFKTSATLSSAQLPPSCLAGWGHTRRQRSRQRIRPSSSPSAVRSSALSVTALQTYIHSRLLQRAPTSHHGQELRRSRDRALQQG